MTRQYREQGGNTMAALQEDAVLKLQRYPAMTYKELVLVDQTATRLAIDDVSYRTRQELADDIQLLFLACYGDVKIIDAQEQVLQLARTLDRFFTVVGRNRTVAIFPGQGSQVVKDLLPDGFLEGVNIIEVPTRRTIDTRGGVQGVAVGNITELRRTFAEVRPQAVIAIDDVVTTGSTVRALQQAVPTRNATWYAASLMMLSPTQRRDSRGIPSGIDGFEGTISPLVYQGVSGIPALNSLSTLVGTSDRSQAVRDRYMRYVEDQSMFLQSVAQIQERMKGASV